jgi:hypothetical protein
MHRRKGGRVLTAHGGPPKIAQNGTPFPFSDWWTLLVVIEKCCRGARRCSHEHEDSLNGHLCIAAEQPTICFGNAAAASGCTRQGVTGATLADASRSSCSYKNKQWVRTRQAMLWNRCPDGSTRYESSRPGRLTTFG